MALPRAYVPSRALLRALSRPQPSRCPLMRPLSSQFLRGKRTRATPSNSNKDAISFDPNIPGVPRIQTKPTLDSPKEVERQANTPLPDDQLDNPNLPTVSWYEQDLDTHTPERLVQQIATAEDRRREKEMFQMLQEDARNPNYDDAVLRRRLLDDLISNPNFADLAEDLKAIKGDVMSKEEKREWEEKMRKETEPEMKELDAQLRMATHQAIQDLINDPEIGVARKELEALRDALPESDDLENKDFQAKLKAAMEKLKGNDALQRKIAALEASAEDEELRKIEAQEKELEEMEQDVDEVYEDKKLETPEDLDKLLLQMKDVMKSFGGDREIEAELNEIINEDPTAKSAGDIEKELDFSELADEIKKLAVSHPPASETSEVVEGDGEKIDPELEAKVDKIMQDPKLMEKLVYIQKLIQEAEEERNRADMTQIGHETAPDPYTLEPSHTTTLKEQIRMAKNDPEHIAALRRLNVDLLPPFNISPAVKSFNQAIELAYVGANDDIRRILWRAYLKARAVPTFLENVSDEAWDLLYYSQAVTWGSNQNRQNHLKILLSDLRNLGRDGPPTHPATLVKRDDGAHLEV